MSFEYSDPTRENDPHALPNVEVFYRVSGEYEIAKEQDEGGTATWKSTTRSAKRFRCS